MASLDPLIVQLTAPDEDVVITAAYALGDSGDNRALLVLIALLESTDNRWIRNAAAVGLRTLRDERAIAPLLRQVHRIPLTGDIGTLVYALQPFARSALLPDFVAVLADGDYEAAHMATDAILAIDRAQLPVETHSSMVARLHAALQRHASEGWREAMIEAAIAHLEAPPDRDGEDLAWPAR